MRTSTLLSRGLAVIAGAVVLAMFGGCAHRGAGLSGAALEGPQQRQADFLAAMTAKDLDRVVGHFAEEAVVHIGNMPPIQGREAIQQLYGNVFRFLRASEYGQESIRLSGNADMAYSTGSVTSYFDSEQGLAGYPGKHLLVWVKRGSEWLIVAYSISNNQNPTGQR